MSNESVLASALQAAVAQAGNSFHLELSRLRFLGAAGYRVVGERTRRFRDRGGPGRADRATGRWAQILLDGLDRLPNVELVESRW